MVASDISGFLSSTPPNYATASQINCTALVPKRGESGKLLGIHSPVPLTGTPPTLMLDGSELFQLKTLWKRNNVLISP